MTGQLVAPVDIPSFGWSVSVSDSTLATTKDKGTGEYEATGLTLPWASVPGATASDKANLLTQDKRAICLMWKTSTDPMDIGTPILFGSISPRTDGWLDTSFTLNSMLDLLDSRYCVREKAYGAGRNGTSTDEIKYRGMSLRGIASEVGWLCTMGKPGGILPIDWQYRGEKGPHERTYNAFDIQNLSCKQIFTKLSNVIGGPDMQLRPYLADSQHVRLRFEAASDGDVYLGQRQVHRLHCRRYGGDLEDVTVDHVGPVQRVYGSGAGTDKAQLTCLAEDLTLCETDDPWPLREMTYSDTDTDKLDLLESHARAVLNANKTPLMQLKGSIDANDTDATGMPLHPLGSFWPGEIVEVALDGFPGLPDGVYRTRLMQMSGDETSKVSLTFDVMEDPIR
nr:hypothetical protein [Bifidobacterium sp. DSM 109959]